MVSHPIHPHNDLKTENSKTCVRTELPFRPSSYGAPSNIQKNREMNVKTHSKHIQCPIIISLKSTQN